MAQVITFEIKGAKEMEDLLKKLGPRLAARAGDKALRAGAKPIVQEAKRLVPRRTKALQRSIFASIKRLGNAQNERVILIGFKPPRSRIAHLIEFGTSKARAQPFMRPALDITVTTVLQEMAKALAQGIETVAGELRKQ